MMDNDESDLLRGWGFQVALASLLVLAVTLSFLIWQLEPLWIVRRPAVARLLSFELQTVYAFGHLVRWSPVVVAAYWLLTSMPWNFARGLRNGDMLFGVAFTVFCELWGFVVFCGGSAAMVFR